MTHAPEPVEFAFPGPARDLIVASILSGEKTATSSLVREYEISGDPLPRVGDRGTVVDSDAQPVVVIEVTEVRVVRLGDVDAAHAVAEGEGFTGLHDWREVHERYWTSPQLREEMGEDVEIDDDTLLVLERFRVVS